VSDIFKKFLQDHNLATRMNPVFVVLPELEGACECVFEFIGEHFTGEREVLSHGEKNQAKRGNRVHARAV
jgi:hypothetical protein